MAISTPITNPNDWEFIGEIYEDFDYESIIRYRKPPIREPKVELVYDASITVNTINKDVFQFAIRNIYKDGQISVFSNYSERVYPSKVLSDPTNPSSSYVDGNSIKITIEPQPSEVKKVSILVRKNDGDWSFVETITNPSSTLIYSFTNKYISGGIDVSDSSRPFDYISSRVDKSTTIGGRIVDVGLLEGVENNFVDVEYDVEYTPVSRPQISSENVVTKVGDILYQDVSGGKEANVRFTITNASGKIKGGTLIRFLVSSLDANNAKSSSFTIYYLTKDEDTKESISKYLNDYRPIFGFTSNLGHVNPYLTSFINVNGEIVISAVLRTGSASGFPNFSANFSSASSPIMQPVPVPLKSIKTGSTIHVGVELMDKNGVYYPVTNIKPVYIQTLSEAKGTGKTIENNTAYHLSLRGKITSVLPPWVYGYRFVYFGSSIEKFVQYPHFISYNFVANSSVHDEMWVNRSQFVSVANKSNVGVPNGNYLNLRFYNFNEQNFRTITKTITETTTPTPIVFGFNYYEFSPYYDVLTNANGGVVVDSITDRQVNIKRGESVSSTYNASTRNTFVNTGVFNCFVRNVYDTDDLRKIGKSIIGSFEDMIFNDSIQSGIIGFGRTNVFLDDYRSAYLKGKIRNGGNYVDNTQINNLARFDVLDYAFVDDQYGKVTQVYPVGQNLRVRQERNSSTIYIGNIQSVSPDGTTQTLQSSKFLGFVDSGSMNIGSKYGDWFKVGSQEFFFDDATKNIYRQSQAGTFSISGKAFTQEDSSDYKIHKLITDISLTNNTKNVAFGYDNENDLLLLTFLGNEAKTIGFHYPTQRWLSYYSFVPENYVSAGITNYYWENGKMYKMNKGDRKTITYQFTSNANPSLPKKFRSIEIIGDLVNFNMNCTIPSGSNYRDMYTRSNKIVNKENKKYIELPRNMKTTSNTPSVAEKDSGIEMRGQFANFELTGNLKLTSINVNND